MKKVRPDDNRPGLGVSSCLLGNNVRYEGDHRRHEYITTVLAESYDLVAVCPELEAGFGVPREATILIGERSSPRMIGTESGEDKTELLTRYVRHRIGQDDLRQISGFIFKSRSPSCGVEKVKLYSTLKRFTYSGTGLFASTLLKRYPYLPVIEEDQLDDPTARDNFLVRVNVLHRLQQLYALRFNRKAMIRFHQSNRDLLSGHGKHARLLDELVNEIARLKAADFRLKYRTLFMAGLSTKSVR